MRDSKDKMKLIMVEQNIASVIDSILMKRMKPCRGMQVKNSVGAKVKRQSVKRTNFFERFVSILTYALARASNISTAGSFLPSKNSKNAPPPVEIYDTLSAISYLSTAASVSPPPAIENAEL